MPRSFRLIIASVAAAGVLAGAGAANAAIVGDPEFTFSPFTKAQAGAGNAVALTMLWKPPVFSGANPQRQEVVVTQLPNGSPQTFTAATNVGSLGPLFVSNGQPLRVSVRACELNSCTSSPDRDTMIDATPPTGSVVINGGAAATNNRTVSLGLTATDPLIENRPGTSSGVTQFAVDVDGNGTFPCDFFIISGQTPDTSGCAQNFAATGQATLPAGDGVKTLGVMYGDGARVPTAPCATQFCAILLGNPILGNASGSFTDTILLDTVKPVARLGQDAITVQRGDAAVFDAAASTDAGGAAASGIDFPATTWDFNDGTAVATGSRVSHTFTRIGTFVGQLRVRDRAGNVSDPKTFTVTVTPRAGETIDGFGSIAGVRGSAAFSLSRISVSAKYSRSRLTGSILVQGVSSQPGTITATIRRKGGGKALATVRRAVVAAPFTRGLRLPPTLLPGTYDLDFAGPGGTLESTLTLRPPREGVASTAKVTLRGGPVARFVFAARPIARLRSKVTVSWAQGRTRLGTVTAGSGRVVTAGLPGGASLRRGKVTATLRAGTSVVAVATARVR